MIFFLNSFFFFFFKGMNVIYEIFFKSIHVSLLKYLAKLIQKKKKITFASLAIYYFHTHISASIFYQY